MRRLMEMDVADSVRARVIAGPADLMTWEVSACIDDSKGMTLAVIGLGWILRRPPRQPSRY